ncbi:MAG TPA: restriction endonuclease [Pyrinomonadaceae bacterium]|nr:restriction endonuclease [Pyrinomonadaceae bacterium]
MYWEDYEKFVERICQELAVVEGVLVFPKREYAAISGRNIEIDLSFELEALGSRIFGIIECKHYKRRISAVQVLAFAKTIELVRAHKGIFVSTVGFQTGAIIEAEKEGIALALLRPNPTDSLKYLVRSPSDDSVLLQGKIRLGSHSPLADNDIAFHTASQLIELLWRFNKPRGSGRL